MELSPKQKQQVQMKFDTYCKKTIKRGSKALLERSDKTEIERKLVFRIDQARIGTTVFYG